MFGAITAGVASVLSQHKTKHKMKAYLAGPMRGKKHYNFPAFDAAAKDLREKGWEIISPADIDRDMGFDPVNGTGVEPSLEECIKRDTVAVLDCEAIILLPGWEKSVGARAELALAEWAGKPAYTYPELKCPHDKSGLPDSGARTVYPTGAQRDAMDGKGYPSDIPPCAITALAKLYENGAKKYDRGNWRIGIPLSRYYDAIFRHCMKAGQGMTDEDHLAAVMWNAAGWMWTQNEIKAGRRPAELNDLQYWEGEKVSAPLELQSSPPLPQS